MCEYIYALGIMCRYVMQLPLIYLNSSQVPRSLSLPCEANSGDTETHRDAHTVAGPIVMLLYPLYASVIAIESPSKEDDEQWLAYWIMYSFLMLEWIPIWYTAKLLLIGWLVLPHFRGAAFVYERFVKKQVRKYIPPAALNTKASSNPKPM